MVKLSQGQMPGNVFVDLCVSQSTSHNYNRPDCASGGYGPWFIRQIGTSVRLSHLRPSCCLAEKNRPKSGPVPVFYSGSVHRHPPQNKEVVGSLYPLEVLAGAPDKGLDVHGAIGLFALQDLDHLIDQILPCVGVDLGFDQGQLLVRTWVLEVTMIPSA